MDSMSDPVRPPFLSTLLYPLPTRPLGIDEMPAYVFQYSPGHYYEGKYAIKVKVYKEGWHRGSKYDYKTYIGEYDTWKDAVRDMRRRRQKLEKKTRSGTRAPTATVPPRRTKRRKQIDWDEVIRAEAIAEAQRRELVQGPDAPADGDDVFVAPPADEDAGLPRTQWRKVPTPKSPPPKRLRGGRVTQPSTKPRRTAEPAPAPAPKRPPQDEAQRTDSKRSKKKKARRVASKPAAKPAPKVRPKKKEKKVERQRQCTTRSEKPERRRSPRSGLRRSPRVGNVSE